MSLLLDALRRAGATRGDEIAEPVNQRPAQAQRTTSPTDKMEEIDLDIDAAEAASSTGGSSGTQLQGPARAEAVFRGGASGGSVIRTAALITLGTLALLGGLVAGGWYYYESTRSAVDRELVRYTPEPSSADPRGGSGETGTAGADSTEVVALDPAALEPAGADQPDTAVGANSAASDAGNPGADAEPDSAGAKRAESGSPDAASGGQEAAGETAVGDAGTAAGAGDDSASGSASPEATTTDNEAAPDTSPAEAPAKTADSGGSAERATSSGGIRAEPEAGDTPIVRRSGGDGRSPLAQALQDGYRALRSGDLMAARAHYRRAVELGPSNRDAHLGAAAVAQRQGNAAAAIEHYRKVLADHPRDPYARSGLVSLQSTADPRQIESELKTLLKQDPNAHALRYALGNLYARENRWSQAQSAYFEAFRAAPKEADYAFNLAVALDQLGQREQAVEYYGRALELAGDGSASFPLESARRRLESLRQ